MVNVNVQLPPIIAAPFPQASESLHRENLLQPAIPKTEKSAAYAKMRDHQERETAAYQSSQIIQKDGKKGQQQNERSSRFAQRRDYFFAKKLKLPANEVKNLTVEPMNTTSYQEIRNVIEKKYLNAVSPMPVSSIFHSI